MSHDVGRSSPDASLDWEKIRVMIVDDQPILREALQTWLATDPGMQIVAVAGSAEQAIDIVLDVQPHVVVMNIEMPGLSCFDAIRRVQAREAKSRFLLLTAHTNRFFVDQALAVGANGFVSKMDGPEQLLEAVRLVAEGGTWYCEAARAVMMTEASAPRGTVEGPASAQRLTPREIDVVRYVARGLSNKEIAEVMCVSRKTVENHCTNLMRKLGLSDRVDVARFAFREGLEVP